MSGNRRSRTRRRLGPWRTSFAVATVLAVTISACSTAERGGYDIADEVLAAVGQTPEVGGGDLVIESDCTRTVTVDEYGFETETLECPDDNPADPDDTEPTGLDPTSPPDLDDILAAPRPLPLWVGGPLVDAVPEELRGGLAELVSRIEAVEAACGSDRSDWRSAARSLTAAADTQIDAVAAGSYVAYEGTPSARALARVIFERAILETGCSQPGGGQALSYEQAADDGTLADTAALATSIGELVRRMEGSLSGPLFHYFSTYPNYLWLRDETDPIDVIVFGTSQAGASIEVSELAEGLGATVGNAFLPGSLAEVQQYWFPEVERFIDPPTVLWLIGPIDLLIDCAPTDRPEQFLERLDNREQAFARSGWFREVDAIYRVLGPRSRSTNDNRGNAAKEPATDAAAVAAGLDEYRDRFAASGFCESRAEVIRDAAAALRSHGRDVIVVGMPVSPVMAELQPDIEAAGHASFERLMTEYLGDYEGVDLIGALQDDPGLWADTTHPTRRGAARFTSLLVTEIEQRQLLR